MARLRPYLEFAAMYAATFVAVLLYSRWREGGWDYVAASLFALVAAIYFAFDQKRSREAAATRSDEWNARLEEARAEVIAEAAGDAVYQEACNNAAEAMSHLSAGDFSIFVSMLRRFEDGEDKAGFMTMSDSPMHMVLERLERLGCSQPMDWVPVHDAPTLPDIVGYELTELGRSNLALFVREADRKRRIRQIIADEMR